MTKILVVDDISADLVTMKELLEKEGYEVTAKTNGAMAIDSLASGKVDLILIDILMPALSGYDLLKLLREHHTHSVKMAYVSIVPENEVDMDNIDGFIQKPFSPESFIEGVKKVLGE